MCVERLLEQRRAGARIRDDEHRAVGRRQALRRSQRATSSGSLPCRVIRIVSLVAPHDLGCGRLDKTLSANHAPARAPRTPRRSVAGHRANAPAGTGKNACDRHRCSVSTSALERAHRLFVHAQRAVRASLSRSGSSFSSAAGQRCSERRASSACASSSRLVRSSASTICSRATRIGLRISARACERRRRGTRRRRSSSAVAAIFAISSVVRPAEPWPLESAAAPSSSVYCLEATRARTGARSRRRSVASRQRARQDSCGPSRSHRGRGAATRRCSESSPISRRAAAARTNACERCVRDAACARNAVPRFIQCAPTPGSGALARAKSRQPPPAFALRVQRDRDEIQAHRLVPEQLSRTRLPRRSAATREVAALRVPAKPSPSPRADRTRLSHVAFSSPANRQFGPLAHGAQREARVHARDARQARQMLAVQTLEVAGSETTTRSR